ncbi:DUF1854 domain-containing protein [bacterium]|nr:MAG: DUF1854 domain-containing protein [bacterium]
MDKGPQTRDAATVELRTVEGSSEIDARIDGEWIEGVKLHRCFPLSEPSRFIALLGKDGKERAILDDLDRLDVDSRVLANQELDRRFVAVGRSTVRAEATVCACPSTERNLGDGIVPADALVKAGARVSFGSDSQTVVDLLDEARQLEQHLRLVRLRRAVLDPGTGTLDGLAARLFDMATVQGARSLGMGTGTLSPGSPADFFTVDVNHPSLVGAGAASLLPGIVFGAAGGAVREVAVAGRLVVRDGRHPLTEQSGRAFQQLARRLYP